jgi:hypothetical protein
MTKLCRADIGEKERSTGLRRDFGGGAVRGLADGLVRPPLQDKATQDNQSCHESRRYRKKKAGQDDLEKGYFSSVIGGEFH